MTFQPDQMRYIEHACKAEGYRFINCDEHSGYLARVERGDPFVYLGTGAICAYPLNSATAFTLATDKTFTYRILSDAELPVPVGESFFITERFSGLRGEGKFLDAAREYAGKQGYPLFVKPNSGSRGAFAGIVQNDDELVQSLKSMSQSHYMAIVQEVVRGEEFRIFSIDGAPQFAYRKRKPVLYGDGKSTIKQLLDLKNKERDSRGLDPLSLNHGELANYLSTQGLTENSVLIEGKTLQYTSALTISEGGEVLDFTIELTESIRQLCETITKKMDLRVFAVDLISQSHRVKDLLDDYKIIEVNANPSMTSLEKIGRMDVIEKIWVDILGKYFTEKG